MFVSGEGYIEGGKLSSGALSALPLEISSVLKQQSTGETECYALTLRINGGQILLFAVHNASDPGSEKTYICLTGVPHVFFRDSVEKIDTNWRASLKDPISSNQISNRDSD